MVARAVVPGPDTGEVLLVQLADDPDAGQIGDGEDRRADLDVEAGVGAALDDGAVDRRAHVDRIRRARRPAAHCPRSCPGAPPITSRRARGALHLRHLGGVFGVQALELLPARGADAHELLGPPQLPVVRLETRPGGEQPRLGVGRVRAVYRRQQLAAAHPLAELGLDTGHPSRDQR